MASPSSPDSHALMVLLSDGANPQCLYAWREKMTGVAPQPGELVPLPDAALEAGASREPAALAEEVFTPAGLPVDILALLPPGATTGCFHVIVLRVLGVDAAEDGWVELGAFEPADAKRVLQLLEQQDLPFEVEADHSALLQPGRFLSQQWGFHPSGSKVKIFVPEAHAGQARALVSGLYPPEQAPPSRPGEPGGKGNPALEIYAAPQASLTTGHSGEDESGGGKSPAEPN